MRLPSEEVLQCLRDLADNKPEEFIQACSLGFNLPINKYTGTYDNGISIKLDLIRDGSWPCYMLYLSKIEKMCPQEELEYEIKDDRLFFYSDFKYKEDEI